MPLYAMMMLFLWQLLPRLGSGPTWSLYHEQTKLCDSMWRNVLFIDNIYP